MPRDVCVNGKGCFLKQILPMRSGFIDLSKSVECQCPDGVSYKCGKDYCTVNNHACNVLQSGALNGTSLPSCQNGNAVLERKFSFFIKN